MNPKLKIILAAILIISTIGGIHFTQDLVQLNKETIFLTKTSLQQYEEYKEQYSEKSFIVAKFSTDTLNTKEIDLSPFAECEILEHKTMPPEFNDLFKLKGEGYLGYIFVCEDDAMAKDLLEYLRKEYRGFSFSGVPYTNILLNEYSKDIKTYLFPGLFIGVLILLVFLTHSLKNGLILFLPCLASASLSLVATKIFFHHSNLITSIVPLLMFVINLALALHLFFTFQELESFKKTYEEKKKPTFLMVSTTFVGFISLYFSNLQAISTFGLLSAFLILISSALNLCWFFLVEDFIAKKEKSLIRIKPQFNYFITKNLIIILSVLSVIFGTFVFKTIPVLTDATEYFPKSSGLKAGILDVTRTIAGQPILNIMIEAPEDKDMGVMNELGIIEERLNKKLNPKGITLISSNIFVRKINHAYAGKEVLPDHFISYATLKSKLPPGINEGYPLDGDYRITLLSSPMNIHLYEEVLDIVEKELKGRKHKYNGLYYHLMIAQKEMISTLFKSFSVSLLVIAIIALLAFRKIKVFFIFLVVNTIPVFISFLFLKFFGLSFNIATVMTYSISLGLIVDSSFHLIHILDQDVSYDYYFKTVVRPVLGSSLLLAFCFFMFAFSSFLPIREFGICLGIIILLGLIFDLKVLPTIFLGRNKLEDL